MRILSERLSELSENYESRELSECRELSEVEK